MAEKNVGKIVQVIGPVIDVEFEAGHLPEIYNALHVVSDGKGGGAVLDVVNSGPQVSPDIAQRLTEPFERGGRTGTRGAGLGLSIVRSVAEAHGGRLALAPRREGGLTVRVTLPAATAST